MGKRLKQYPKRVQVRATSDEHARLTELAKQSELSLSRFLVEPGLTGKAPTPADRVVRERALLQLIRVGNNLNQIAKQLNSQRGVLSSSTVEDTLAALKTMLERIEEVWQKR
ncbi:MAG: plasmid mobilization protein [Blastocatellia bacterium]